VSLKGKEAIVDFDPTEVTVTQMLEAINRIGFRASMKGSPSSPAPH